MNSPKHSHPKKKASCQKRNMRWVAKSEEHKGYCRPKHNKSPMTRKGRSRSNAKYSGAMCCSGLYFGDTCLWGEHSC